jgi:hypothetical protein
MIFEHQHFFFNSIPKTGSKSTTWWCKQNAMLPVRANKVEKPIFATYRDTRDRIISGITEDLYFITKEQNGLTGEETFSSVEYMYRHVAELWSVAPYHPISKVQCHYATLQSYLGSQVDLSQVHWVSMNQIDQIDTVINATLGFAAGLTPLPKEQFILATDRPPKEWFYNIISEHKSAVDWIEQRIQQDYKPELLSR